MLREDGTPAPFELVTQADDEHPAGTLNNVPYINRSGVRPPPMLLADDLRYVTGFTAGDTQRDQDDSERRNQAFIALVKAWRDSAPDDPAATAVVAFFDRGLHARLKPENAKPTDVVAFMTENGWAHEQPSAVAFWGQVARERKSSAASGRCLVCGTEGPLLDTVPEMVKAGAIPAGSGRGRDAALVSVNRPRDAAGRSSCPPPLSAISAGQRP